MATISYCKNCQGAHETEKKVEVKNGMVSEYIICKNCGHQTKNHSRMAYSYENKPFK